MIGKVIFFGNWFSAFFPRGIRTETHSKKRKKKKRKTGDLCPHSPTAVTFNLCLQLPATDTQKHLCSQYTYRYVVLVIATLVMWLFG